MLESKWRQVEGGDMHRVVREAERRFREYSSLVRYLESEIFNVTTQTSLGASNSINVPTRLISKDYETLLASYTALRTFSAAVIQQLKTKGEVDLQRLLTLDLIYYDPHLPGFSQAMYLEDLTEDTIFELYHSILDLPLSPSYPQGFTQAARDALFRLKMLSVDQRLRSLEATRRKEPASEPDSLLGVSKNPWSCGGTNSVRNSTP